MLIHSTLMCCSSNLSILESYGYQNSAVWSVSMSFGSVFVFMECPRHRQNRLLKTCSYSHLKLLLQVGSILVRFKSVSQKNWQYTTQSILLCAKTSPAH